MLTVDFDRLGIGPGTKVIDVGCGAGRQASRPIAAAPTSSRSTRTSRTAYVDTILRAMAEAGEAPAAASAKVVVGDALACRIRTGRSTA